MRRRGFADRSDAGHALAEALGDRPPDTVVLGLARGGVPVAAVVARELGASLDVMVVRKLGAPGQPELALGAITAERRVFNTRLIADLGVSPADLDAVAEREQHELRRREQAYRQGRAALDLAGRLVVVVDDGVATGASMRVAALALRDAGVARLVIAVPTAPPTVGTLFADVADEVVCVHTPAPFAAVGLSYLHFDQVDDAEVQAALAQA
ncbi:hypothetical protein BCA37_19310 [Mycobacterium sp. djl-10]|nr:hypothetical protein BCA37_19310 [Mycobacterium sp. djl-10]